MEGGRGAETRGSGQEGRQGHSTPRVKEAGIHRPWWAEGGKGAEARGAGGGRGVEARGSAGGGRV